ncbi:MAG TPA: heme peroxidase family protein [Jiangellaceae bacterium]|nr:heme peroxidase family protein [Jiangellaceae bacterium]
MTPADRSARPSWHDRRLSRRGFLAGTAATLSAGALVGRLPAGAHAAPAGDALHGVELRGMYLTSKDRLAEGRFGLMFKRLPPFAPPDELLEGLARTMVEEPGVPNDDVHLNTSPVLFAGFTFIGQFIDHDITFDTTPLNLQLADPDATVNFRTARYDLDSVYGRGPVNEPQFYDPADRDKLLVTPNVNGVVDMARDGNRAIIPDPRNDENLIILQLHKAVAQFHNRLVDYMRAQGMRPEWVFEAARRLARWHYQWAVIHDFLPRFVDDELVGPAGTVYKEVAGKPPVITLSYYKPTNKDGRPFMPVEFAVAAYRFAHSIIRPAYIINEATAGGIPIFEPEPNDGFNLNGGRPLPADLVIEWKNILPDLGNPAARKPRKIDTKLSPPLTSLPGSAVPPPDPTKHLAIRNTLRGKRVGLPSGQQVARAMRATVLSNATLGLSNDPGWKGEAPLWFYILKEAELPPANTERLGQVGGRIVAEVLVGLLQRDPNSYLYLDPAWKPAPPIASTTGQFTFADLLKFAGAA